MLPQTFLVLSKVLTLIELLPSVPVAVNLWHVQNVYFEMAKAMYAEIFSKAKAGDQDAAKWVESFRKDRAGPFVQYRCCFAGKLGGMEHGC